MPEMISEAAGPNMRGALELTRPHIHELWVKHGDSEYQTLLELIDAAMAAQPQRVVDWQPIETAPKNEMFIWAYRRERKWSVGLAYRNISGGWSDAYGDQDPPRYATHWAPMPAPPDE